MTAAKRPQKVIGYGRVSTREQGDSGLGLDAQRSVIELYCERTGLELVTFATDVASGKTTSGRVGLDRALATCTAGVADGLIVAKLDRLARSVFDFAHLLRRANTERWTLIIVDIGLDLSTPAGKMVAQIMASVAEWEREIISARTKDALVEVRRRGTALGRPSGLPDSTIARIHREHADGKSLYEIAKSLRADGIPSGQGGKWHTSSVQYVLSRYGPGVGAGELDAPAPVNGRHLRAVDDTPDS
jgi:DNA invertase Pin-like site-specific DNA recombinase